MPRHKKNTTSTTNTSNSKTAGKTASAKSLKSVDTIINDVSISSPIVLDTSKISNLPEKLESIDLNIDDTSPIITEDKKEVETLDENGNPVKVKKKRGRKPKPKPENYEPPKPKKRGRKPKDKFKFDDLSTAKFEPEKTEDNNFIVKLPISCKELDNELKLTNINYDPDIIEPRGFDIEDKQGFNQFDKNFIPQNMISNEDTSLDNNLLTNQTTAFKKMNEETNHKIENMLPNFNTSKLDEARNFMNAKQHVNNFKTSNKGQTDVESYNKHINDLLEDVIQDENKKELSQIEKLLNKKYKQTKQVHLLHSVCITTQNNEWMRKTDISCFWDCHSFNHTPWGIPIKYDYHSGIFTLFGIFCSPNCALAYLLQDENNTTALWEKVSLLNLLHYKIYETDENIVPAPDKICLKTFGGPLKIEQYRCLTLKNNKNYCVNFPPCSMVSPVLEETKKAFNQDSFFIPMDKNKINQIQTNLKIKRTKPINSNKNTLDNVIKISYS